MNSTVINIEHAIAALEGGDYSTAKNICEKILSLNPDDAVALQVLGISHYQLGEIEPAINSLKQSLNHDPENSWTNNSIASILQEIDRLDEALPYALKATELDSRNADAQNNLGMIYRKINNYKKAEEKFTGAIRIDRTNPLYLVNLGELYIAVNRLEDAERVLRKALQYDPINIAAKNNIGTILQKKGKLHEALNLFKELQKTAPNDPEILNNIGLVYQGIQNHELAKESYRRAIDSNPEYFPAYINLANWYIDQGNKFRAIEVCKSVLQKNQNYFPAKIKLAYIYKEQDRYAQSIQEIEEAIHLAPGNVDGYLVFAEILEHFGKLDLAEQQYINAVAKSEDATPVKLKLAAFAERTHQLDKAINLLEGIQVNSDVAVVEKGLLQTVIFRRQGKIDRANQLLNHLADVDRKIETSNAKFLSEKAKVLEIQEKYDGAIDCYKAAARLRKKESNLHFDKKNCEDVFSQQIDYFSIDILEKLPKLDPVGETSEPKPLFIVGFPRSGTTLTEQILCSHPRIVAGDELEFLDRVVGQIVSDLGSEAGYPFCLKKLIELENQQEVLGRWRRQYLDQARENGIAIQGASFFTDKMPLNLNYLPIISMIFPDSPIIHMVRNPMDSVLSTVFSGFSATMPWAHDLEDAAFYFVQTARLANYLVDKMKLNYMLLRYEDLVSDQEIQTRKIIKFLGLEWDDKCLDFHKIRRVSKTASYEQVTKKIYKTSIARYKHFEKHLEKPLEILKPAMEQFGYLD